MRCVHEASLYEDSCFLTLTYSPENLPDGSTLVLEHFQQFMKRLRKKFPPASLPNPKNSNPAPGIRFFHCGEYGEKKQRPHYHALLFNFDFSDKIPFKCEPPGGRFSTSETPNQTWVSPMLTKLWGHGELERQIIGSVTFESAAYTARYLMKKITGEKAEAHYHGRKPEYITMSRRPGIGKLWFDQFKNEVFPSDEIIVKGKQTLPPKYYLSLLEKFDPAAYAAIKTARKCAGKKFAVDDYQLAINEEVKIASMRGIKRSLE